MGNGLWDYGQWRYGDGQKEGRQGGAKSIIIYLFPLQMSARRRERASASMATTHACFFYIYYIYIIFRLTAHRKKVPFAMTDAAAGPSAEAASSMLSACSAGDVARIRALLSEDPTGLLQSHQDPATGWSPLMEAARAGHAGACEILLEGGAPWNALDRGGKCAGNHATDAGRWDVVNLLVDAGTRAELILGASIRAHRGGNWGAPPPPGEDGGGTEGGSGGGPAEYEPSSKPDYLQRAVRYTADGNTLLDDDDDAVMMEWERPLMEAHASIITGDGTKGRKVMNVGFGMGIIDMALQRYEPSLHVIVEAHPAVHAKMVKDGWDKKPGVRVEFGRWQEVLPRLIDEGVQLDGIFFDTYAESYMDMEDFHQQMVQVLAKPGGIYSFFNGLAPDNLFFHGVACQCVKLQLAALGLDSEFAQCQFQGVKEKDWEGVRRKYWHGRETYYLPIVTWTKEEKIQNQPAEKAGAPIEGDSSTRKNGRDGDEEGDENDGEPESKKRRRKQ